MRTKRTAETSVTESGGNVYADPGLKNADALPAKSMLAAHITRIIAKRRLTQGQAAEILGLNQPKISSITNGRLEGFSTDRLLRLLNALGCDVKISVSRPHPKTPGHVMVA